MRTHKNGVGAIVFHVGYLWSSSSPSNLKYMEKQRPRLVAKSYSLAVRALRGWSLRIIIDHLRYTRTSQALF